MKLKNQPQEKHLVFYVHISIIDTFNSKWINEVKNNTKKNIIQKEQNNLKQKIQFSDNFRNILW